MKLIEYVEKIARNPNQLRHRNEAIIEKHRAWYRALAPVLEDLRDIRFAVIKGDILSITAYGEIGYRDSHDVDMLIEQRDLKTLYTVFMNHGFKPVLSPNDSEHRELTRKERIMLINSHQEVPLYKILNGGERLEVDINVDLFWGEYSGKRIGVDTFLSHRTNVNIFGCDVPTLDAAHQFIEVCLHHYKEMNAPYILKICNPINSRMLEDIYCLYARHIKKDCERILLLCKQYKVLPYIYYMLCLTSIAFPDSELDRDKEKFYTQQGELLLNKYGLADNERKTWRYDLLTILDAPEVFSFIEKDLSQKDLEKIDAVWSIFL